MCFLSFSLTHSLTYLISLSLLLQSGGNEALLEGKEERTGENDKDVWGVKKEESCLFKDCLYVQTLISTKINAFFLQDKVP